MFKKFRDFRLFENKINEKYEIDKVISSDEIASMLTVKEIKKIIKNNNCYTTHHNRRDTINSVTKYLKENFSGWVKLSVDCYPHIKPNDDIHYHVVDYRFRCSSYSYNIPEIYIKIMYDTIRTRISDNSNYFREKENPYGEPIGGGCINFWIINDQYYKKWNMSTIKYVAPILRPDLDPYGEDEWGDNID